MYLFEGLKQQVSEYLPSEQVELVESAFKVAFQAHDGQMRSSGDPYITHPVAVANILADMKLDHETLMAALLHDVIEDTNYNKDDLAELYGTTVADLVEGVSKLEKIRFQNPEEFQAANYRKMIMAMTQDIRVILIKLADRTHNMRTIGSLRTEKRHRIARETLEIFAPIANRLGIHDIKNELELLGFKALYPLRYRALASELRKASDPYRQGLVSNIQQEIESRLIQANIAFIVKGRAKHLYSIYRKMEQSARFHDIMDIYAFRVLVDSIDTCYRVLGMVHNLYKPIETRFKDYIAIPKTNGYQSLHTSLIGPKGTPIEIQIRTHEMDLTADKGIAAHWAYKQSEQASGTTSQQKAQVWMQSLLELQQSANSSAEFVDNVKTELFPDEIYVFTPGGGILELAMGATPVDFAYAVHTDVGNRCVGARVDHKLYPLNKSLDTGQTVEIITSKRGSPNAAWLNFVVTAKARQGIRNYLKNQQIETATQLGKRLLDSALGQTQLQEIPTHILEQVLGSLKVEHLEHLYREIGLGNYMPLAIAKRLLGDFETPFAHSSHAIITGTEGMLVSYAKCCRPIPGDSIVAFVSQGKGLTIHREECGNIKGWEKESANYFRVKWGEFTDKLFESDVFVEIINHQGALAKLANQIASTGANIQGLSTEEKESSLYIINIALTVTNRKHLANIMRKIRVMPDVQKVYRKKQ